MDITSATQTQYTSYSRKTTNTSKEEYKTSDSVIEKKGNENKWIDQLSKDTNNLLTNTSLNNSMDFQSKLIKDKINQYAQNLMVENGDAPKTELETLKLINGYKSELLQDYKASIENSTDTVMSSEQQAIIQVLMEENTQEASSLEALLATKTGTTITQETKETEKMSEMQEKYKDVFLPMPASFSQEREDLQTAIIRERYPDYLPMDEALEKHAFKADPNNSETSEAKVLREEANRQFIENHGGQEAWDEEVAFIRSVFEQYPNNLTDKWHDIPNAKERANVFNAGVYEGLEKGQSVHEATGKVTHIVSLYLNNNVLWTQRVQGSNDFFVGEGKTFTVESMEKYNNEKIIYDDLVLDLREYGFDRNLPTRRIYDNESQMIISIQNQLDYADFLIDNPDIVQKAFNEMNEDFNQGKDIYSSYINPAKELIEPAELALDIFSKYKIF